MAKTMRVPSKAQMEKNERQWKAEQLVIDGLKHTQAFKNATREAAKQLEIGEKAAKAAFKPLSTFRSRRK